MKEVVRGLTERRTPEGVCVLRTHYSADPDRDPALNPQWKAAERRKYTSQGAWDREQEIIHSAGGGERLFADILSRWGHKIIIDPADSGFEPSPDWQGINGMDHGKANPTAALVSRNDYDGVIYILREYYQPGLSPKQHRANLLALEGFTEYPASSDPSIFYKTQAQSDGTFKAISQLYAEEGIENLTPAPENNELLGMERILEHWLNLDEREPTLKIVCPRAKQEIQKPIYGVHNDGCPNLLWELRRTRREELTAAQLVNKNPTEKIVDKDNHLRDALKYIVLSLPGPSEKSIELQLRERMSGLDPTSAMIARQKFARELEAENAPIMIGGAAERRRRMMGRR